MQSNMETLIYTPRIQKAVHYSIHVHEVNRPERQLRKGKNIAYITHPLTVGLILARAGASEDVIIAGILHDTIEDSHEDYKVTEEMLGEEFGEEVARLVAAVTENDKSLTWLARKQEALEHISDFTHDEVLVKSSDVLSNGNEILVDYAHIGEKLFERFGGNRDLLLEYQLKTIDALIERSGESPLTPDLRVLRTQIEAILRRERA